MSTFLLDVNVLVALVRTRHSHHEQAKRWFASGRSQRWATCPLTEAGFVRVVSNPRFTAQAVDVGEAMQILVDLTSLPGHEFWPADFDVATAIAPFASRFFGHQQVPDLYLLALVVRNKGRLVTFDRGIAALAGAENQEYVRVL